MYRGFSLALQSGCYKDYFRKGLEMTNDFKTKVHWDLDSFLSPDGVLDGERMQRTWFPGIVADIFISHSHRDDEDTIALAGYLYSTFGLTSFVDSCIWGYAYDLLWSIDNRYCKNIGSETFSYESRNNSTAHVHMMLSTALSKMIDKTECLFFFNTPNSISTHDAIGSATKSPWIYSEMSISSIIRKKVPDRFDSVKTKAFTAGGAIEMFSKRELEVEHKLSLDHLTPISISQLDSWERSNKIFPRRSSNALDGLYDITSLKKL